MHFFTAIFLIFFAIGLLLRLWLNIRQIRHIRAHRGSVPAAFSGQIDDAAHRKAADYSVARYTLGRWDALLDAVVLLSFTLAGGINLLDRYWSGFEWHPYISGSLVVLSVLLVTMLLELPLSIYRTFVIEARFGFNRMTGKLFVADMLKGLLLTAAIGLPLLLATLWFMDRSGEFWWLWVWGLWMSFSLLLTWAYPTFIAPLFNRFSPLADETLVARIKALLERCGFTYSGVYVMDGSKRSAHGNAYFTGFGKSKRIVFFDTLMDDLSHEEIEAVLAHELGHFKLRHIIKRMIVSAIFTLLALALLGWLTNESWFYTALGISNPSDHAALLIFLLVSPTFTYLLTPLSSAYSRKHEFEADRFAIQHADGKRLITALTCLYRENANTLTPDPLHSRFYDSHPPALERIRHIEEAMHA